MQKNSLSNPKKKIVDTRFIATAAVIAALYAALTYVSALLGLGYGMFQLRISEAMTVLPYFTPAAIPGLFVGCILGNMLSPFQIIDIAVGSCATLLAAWLSRKMPHKLLVPLPPVVCNSVFVGTELHFVLPNTPLLPAMGWVALGEVAACYVLGLLLLFALERAKIRKWIG